MQKSPENSKIYFLLSILFFIIGSFFMLSLKENFEKELSLSSLSWQIDFEKRISLFFVGDIMLDRGVEAKVKKYGNYDWRFPFEDIAQDIKKADILFGNLEGPLSDKGRNVGTIYSFRFEPEAVEGLKYAGFDVLSLANNHVFDYTETALKDTFLRLKEAGIEYTGAGFDKEEAHSPVIIEKEGVKMAFLAYSNIGTKYWEAEEYFSGIAWLDETIVSDIKSAKDSADIVIVSFHWGEEYKTFSNLEQQFYARLAIDSGADLIVGHHPHVVQEIEEYKGKYIAYSLGNFVFDQDFSEETMEGILLQVFLKGKKIDRVLPARVKLNKNYQPSIQDPMR